ncbi:carbohydrate ABC transporter permease [Petrotoga sp. 9PWA.NaAc.5.4]|uniref:carbohydrate ABC transporter permease n=1 Tax=Petrotoga sp. 9PWA.NaAc.5.4 TaxID=1434328 RepID=UPI000CA66FE4|nr:sugar ABC transporter permease [Petrotoga sp. 9PWA.NaAc.5.4]PNR92511.1 ABC transporter permease [Petrotoga sp. 9PWA.NaAc.5.4]
MSKRTGLLLILPAFIILIAIFIGPTIYTIVLSFSSYSMSGIQFVGMNNFIRLVNDPNFWTSFFNTLIFVGVTVPIELVLGFVLALVANRAIKGRALIRVALLIPWALPAALDALAWRWMYNTDYGLFNSILINLSIIDNPINWLGQIPLAMISMMIESIWKTSSFMALLILTGLQTIPSELYEAAKIDGASSWQSLRKITIPLVMPSIMVSLLFRTGDAFRAFELPYNLTGGGPVNSTMTLSVYAYNNFFQYLDFSYSSTVALVQFLILLVLAVFYLRTLRWDVYE